MIDLRASDWDGIEFAHEMQELAGTPIITIADQASTTAQPVAALTYVDDFVRHEYLTCAELALCVRRVLSRLQNFGYASGPEIKIAEGVFVDQLNC